MMTPLAWFLLFLGVGVVNVVVAGVQGVLILTTEGRNEPLTGLVEAIFYILLWPLQVLFWAFVQIHNLTGWVLEQITGGRR